MIDRYDELYKSFRWDVPARLNIAHACCVRWAADPSRIALHWEDEAGATATYSFRDIQLAANRLSNALAALGVRRGDRVAIILPQRPETAIAYMAVFQMGAIALPLSHLFGPEALEYRLADSGASVLVTDTDSWPKVASIRDRLPDLRAVIVVDGQGVDGTLDYDEALASASPRFDTVDTAADDPAIIIYTSGTTGPPKGALHGHRVLAGHLPGFELQHDFFPQPGDRIWTPADWAWIGGLYDVLVPALSHGMPVVAYRAPRFDPEQTLDLMEHVGIRNVFMPATALRMLRAAAGSGAPRLRTVASGGETVGEETTEWVEERLGVRLNEFYGQTEANLLLGNCSAWPARPGSMGLPYPGHDVRLLDGELAVRVEGNPVVFLGYWRNPEATAAKVRDGWLLTGDLAEEDGDGYLWFVGRVDDLISSGGYRIGPGEIEDCLIRHSSVALAAAIGVPDETRGEVVKAFVVTAPGVEPGDALASELRTWVRERLAPYEVPRSVEFVDELPLTVTGKIRRNELRRLEAERG
jgi:acetyl-CoA synthetase